MIENALFLGVTSTDPETGKKVHNNYSVWKTINVFRSIMEMSATFSLSMTDMVRGEGLPLIKRGDPCVISIKPEPTDEPQIILTGNVERVSGSMDDKVSFTISGRDISGDLVDSSVVGASEWKDMKVEDWIEDLIKRYPVEVVREASVDTGEKIKTINYDQGTKYYELIADQIQPKQLLLFGRTDGSIIISRVGQTRLDTAFVEGENILSATSDSDGSEIFSEYIVKSSRESTKDDANEEDATQIEGCFKDTRGGRLRELIVLPESVQDNVSAKNRAAWEASTRIARAEIVTIVRQGWQPALNQLAVVKIPSLGVDAELIIVSYNLVADNEGKRTEFTFAHPRAFEQLVEDIVKDENDSKLNE